MRHRIEMGAADREIAREMRGALHVAARSSLVNRTRRVVRARAEQMSARRNKMRSLWAPMAVYASMIVILVSAVWTLLDQYDEMELTGAPDSSYQYIILLLWFLPVSGALLGMVWFRRNQSKRSRGEMA
jgi:protein-S-isoprenylcysteine O-methyltransferase Ste14